MTRVILFLIVGLCLPASTSLTGMAADDPEIRNERDARAFKYFDEYRRGRSIMEKVSGLNPNDRVKMDSVIVQNRYDKAESVSLPP
jgi:hypothetical protein